MASNDPQNSQAEMMFEDARQQIGLAVRSIQWSYAIFWSITQPGVLKWGDGFYNGQIKTKSKAQAAEQDGKEMCSLRSDQLRELFESLAATETNPQAKKLHSALSPEDLSEPEWFYLVCMSFIFHAGQELPGKALEKGQPVWLCNAHLADNKVFGRSLLAKSASMKTVACFPVPGGVVELGVTEKVAEDATLIERITNYLRDYKKSDLTAERPSCSTDHVCSEVNILDARLASMVSPHTSTTEFSLDELDNSFIVDSINEEVAHLQSWQFIDEDLIDYVADPVDKITASSEKLDLQYPLEPPECNQMRYTPLSLPDDEMHYQSVISAILQTSAIGSQYANVNKPSSFVSYRKGGYTVFMKSNNATTPQRMLKKVLTEFPKMHCDGLLEALENDDRNVVQRECEGTCLPEAEDLVDMDLPEVEETGLNHVLAERRRREKLKRRFLVLRSLVPMTTKVDKVSILDDTIKYLKELERRIGELDSAKETTKTKNMENTKVRKRQGQDTTERTSDNYEQEESPNPKPSNKKRKACHADENKNNEKLLVEVEDKDLRIELRCAWRRRLLPELMETLSNLNIDFPSVQTHTANGILLLKITSKLQGFKIAPTRMIKQEIQRIVNNC